MSDATTCGRPGLAARLRERRRGTDARHGPLTVGGLLATVAHLVLWLAVGVLLVRGLAGTLDTERPVSAPVGRQAAVASWPDDAARAFAVAFTSAYLTGPPGEDWVAHARELEAFAAPELVAELAPRREQPDSGKERARLPGPVTVRSASVANTARLDDDHALVTVAATLDGPAVSPRLVTVPIARDAAGGLVVYDLPSFAAAPRRAAVEPPGHEPLLGPDRDAIVDVLTRFLRAYLAGDTEGLAYLIPPDTPIAAAAGGLELADLTSVGAAGPATGDRRLVLATVQARDARSGAVYALRYRVGLVRRDRWYVAAVNEAASAGGVR